MIAFDASLCQHTSPGTPSMIIQTLRATFGLEKIVLTFDILLVTRCDPVYSQCSAIELTLIRLSPSSHNPFEYTRDSTKLFW